MAQDKLKEIEFFDRHAEDYDVFTPDSSARLIDAFRRMTGLTPGSRVADLGCGSGAFSTLLQNAGYSVVGLDISPKLIAVGWRLNAIHLSMAPWTFCTAASIDTSDSFSEVRW